VAFHGGGGSLDILQEHGIVNQVLRWLHVTDHPLTLLPNRFAVVIEMAHHCLPYAVFPIFAVMIPLDSRTEKAAESLGAGGLRCVARRRRR
jgi:putative spermidine/putrescine transport system permease protein